MLTGNLNDLKDGEVFLEIILNFLKINGKDYIFNEEIELFDRYETPEKFEIILRLLKILSDDNIYFDKVNYDSCKYYLFISIYLIKDKF